MLWNKGYSRRTLKENLRFYEIALSSAAENCSQLHVLKKAKQISQTEFELLDKKLYEIENKLIKMNKTLVQKLKNDSSWNSEYK